MSVNWEEVEQEIKSGKEPVRKKFNNPSLFAIAGELSNWWSGISDGSIKFVNGFPLLAGYVPAFIPGHMIVISGYTSAGKSQLLAQITNWCAGDQKAKTIVFSNEDKRMEKLITMVAIISENIHRKKMLLGHVDEKEKARAYEIFNIIHDWPLQIYDDVYTLSDMEAIIKAERPAIVILDYVQNVHSQEQNLYAKMCSAAQNIFRIAQKYDLTFIVASQVSNDSVNNSDSEVISLKGAGELAASAHTVIQLKKNRKSANMRELLIQIKKNKAFGSCGELDAEFNENWTQIVERRCSNPVRTYYD